MEISLRHIGRSVGNPAKCIELTVSYYGTTLTMDITDIYGEVDESFIENLRDVANELEDQNRLIALSGK